MYAHANSSNSSLGQASASSHQPPPNIHPAQFAMNYPSPMHNSSIPHFDPQNSSSEQPTNIHPFIPIIHELSNTQPASLSTTQWQSVFSSNKPPTAHTNTVKLPGWSLPRKCGSILTWSVWRVCKPQPYISCWLHGIFGGC
jgi:hypothetical protein